jgi:hypothetical protein
MPEPTESLTFLTTIAALASRLAADRMDLYSVSYHSPGFGSWQLEVGRRTQRVLVSWDGKDRHLRISTAKVPSGTTARDWQLAEEHDFRKRRIDIVQLLGTAEAAIVAHAGA